MKICTKCDVPKHGTDFAKRSSSKDGLSSWCKKCFAENAANKYRSDEKERQRKLNNRSSFLQGNREKLRQLLESSKCVDCELSDWRVLEFDHRESSLKSFNISEAIWSKSWESILKEIEKCEIRCANCHRIRTSEQFDLWRSKHRDIA